MRPLCKFVMLENHYLPAFLASNKSLAEDNTRNEEAEDNENPENSLDDNDNPLDPAMLLRHSSLSVTVHDYLEKIKMFLETFPFNEEELLAKVKPGESVVKVGGDLFQFSVLKEKRPWFLSFPSLQQQKTIAKVKVDKPSNITIRYDVKVPELLEKKPKSRDQRWNQEIVFGDPSVTFQEKLEPVPVLTRDAKGNLILKYVAPKAETIDYTKRLTRPVPLLSSPIQGVFIPSYSTGGNKI